MDEITDTITTPIVEKISSTNDYDAYFLWLTNLNCLFFVYIAIAFFLSAGIGWYMVEKIRHIYRTVNKLQLLALIPLVSPVIMFYLLHFLSVYAKIVNVVIADSFSFGFLMGILYTLSVKPSGNYTIKLIAKRLPEEGSDESFSNVVWLESKHVKVGELRTKLAIEMNVESERILIESGKGRILDDLESDFFKIMRDSIFISIDFFGYSTCTCYVTLLNKDQIPDTTTSIGNSMDNVSKAMVRKRSGK